jgi:nucleotidyltransferase/DNA polymerase involved in DNA repair
VEKEGQTTFGDVAQTLSVAIGIEKEKLLFRMSTFGSDNHKMDEQWITNAKEAPKVACSLFMLNTPVLLE